MEIIQRMIRHKRQKSLVTISKKVVSFHTSTEGYNIEEINLFIKLKKKVLGVTVTEDTNLRYYGKWIWRKCIKI
jgi:hypothetical protein